MSDKEKWVVTQEGYQPELIKKGYQPMAAAVPSPEPGFGYQPASTGDNPTNVPAAPMPPKR